MTDIGFLGLGKMGTSIAQGILAKGLYDPQNISFFAPSQKTQEKGTGFGLVLAQDERDLVKNAKIIVLAIEPQKYEEVFAKLAGLSFVGKTVVSLAPGKTISYLRSVFAGASICRAMPNTPSLIGKGVTTLAFDETPNQDVVALFHAVGIVAVVEERQIDEAIPLQGSMPAYTFAFVKAFVDHAVSLGIEESEAKKLALNAIIGSCELALQSDKDLDALIDSVCSRGGATIAGLEKLREEGFEKAIDACYEACVKRSEELKGK